MAGTTISGSHITGIAVSGASSNLGLVTGTIDASGVALWRRCSERVVGDERGLDPQQQRCCGVHHLRCYTDQ